MTCAAYHLIILIAADVLALPRVGISVLGAGQSGRGNLNLMGNVHFIAAVSDHGNTRDSDQVQVTA